LKLNKFKKKTSKLGKSCRPHNFIKKKSCPHKRFSHVSVW